MIEHENQFALDGSQGVGRAVISGFDISQMWCFSATLCVYWAV